MYFNHGIIYRRTRYRELVPWLSVISMRQVSTTAGLQLGEGCPHALAIFERYKVS